MFDQFAQMILAAIDGLGVALLPEFLAGPELADGRLVTLWGEPVSSEGSYFLVWPRRARNTAAGRLSGLGGGRD